MNIKAIAVRCFLILALVMGLARLPVYAQAGNGLNDFVPGEVLVGVRADADNTSQAVRISAEVGALIHTVPALHLHRLKLLRGMAIQDAIARLRRHPEVLYAEPNYYIHILGTPNDPGYNLQYGPQKIAADRAWSVWHPQSQVVIAILDTGVDTTHPDLTNKIYRDANGVLGYDAFFDSRSPTVDNYGHGTICAGIAAAQINNGIGVAGVAGWDGGSGSDTSFTRLMPVKVLDTQDGGKTFSGTVETLAAGITWAADHGAKVMNMSVGTHDGSTTLNNAVIYGSQKGCVLVSSAGADGVTRLLWNNADGTAALWFMDSGGKLLGGQNFGPYPGWTAVDVAVSPVNKARLLWINTAGQIAVWSVDNSGAAAYGPVYGPYSGYTAARIAAGADGLTWVLWNKTDGTAVLWLMGQAGAYNNSYETSFGYGPYTGWTASDVSVGTDFRSRLLWSHNDGTTIVWSIDNTGTPTYGIPYGPYPGFLSSKIAAGPDGFTRVLWSHNDGAMALWLLGLNNAYQASFGYGPY